MLRSLLVALAVFSSVGTDPIIIRSGVSSHKDAGRHEDANVFDLNSAKGISNFEGEEGFNKDSEGKHVQAQDSGRYNEANAQKNLHSNEKNFADDKYHQSEGGELSDYNKKSASKKGHHKSGFSKSFHKDETGSSSSYYDDSDDEGKEVVHNNKKNLYGDSGAHSQRGADLDDRRYAQDQGRQGYYHNAGNYDRDAANNRGYNSRRYHDAHENEGRRNAADRYGEEGRYGHEKYLKGGPHYYEPDPYHGPTKKITIYEDPRYDGHEKYPSSYDNDYIQLELKRPPRDYDYRDYRDYRDYKDYKYYDRRPTYDYYYY
ncbi:hypothetical protein Zmor_009118 [Zophobas morio]|uniref:Uncharacterized protein n=1 Tax=Zophobas morio TaxID=2755281 RepID=A0AA38IIE3_9CUCU|nr:hypothetical protein Zmor_009118 [Zophobas morio]